MFTKSIVDSPNINEDLYEEEDLTLIEDKNYSFKPEDSIIGIGVISVNYDNESATKKLNVYDDKNKLILKIQLNDSQVVTTYNGKKITQYEEDLPLNPRLFSANPEYFSLAFDCIDTTKTHYKVIVDRKTSSIGYIKKDEKSFIFETIEQYVKGWINLGFDINRLKNPVREEPDEKSKIIEDSNVKQYNFWSTSHFETELNGDWLKVKLAKDKYGWVRWRKGNKFLITMYFAC